MNPRYLAYCKAHDRDPDAMLAHDTEAWPGGRMTGFICWIRERWAEWRKENGRHPDAFLTPEDHAAFDAWLEQRT